MIKNTFTHSQGYSLIEVMIAITILMVAIVAPMTIAVKSIQSSQYAMEQNTATFLAQEAVGVIETMRNQAVLTNLFIEDEDSADFWGWTENFSACESATGCNFDVEDPYRFFDSSTGIVGCNESGENCRLDYQENRRSAYQVNGGGEPSQFTRRVFIDNLTDQEITVRVEVEWGSNFLGQEQKVSVSTTYFNAYEHF